METTQLFLPGFTRQAARIFMDHSRKLVSNLSGRMRAAGFTGKLSLEDGRGILEMAIERGPCPYCGEVPRMREWTLDHPMPLARGGDPYTVIACCRRCNQRKGDMTPDAFQRLLKFLKTLAAEDRDSVLRRLTAGGSFFRMRRALMSAREKVQKITAGQNTVSH